MKVFFSCYGLKADKSDVMLLRYDALWAMLTKIQVLFALFLNANVNSSIETLKEVGGI